MKHLTVVKYQRVKARQKLRERSIRMSRKQYFLRLLKILSMLLLIFVYHLLITSVILANAQTTTTTLTTSSSSPSGTSETTSNFPMPTEYTKNLAKRPNFWTTVCKAGKIKIRRGCCIEGGCSCLDNPKLCLQCGIQGACESFCNVTISSSKIKKQSGLSWAVVEPGPLNKDCYYYFQGSMGQRIEIKIEKIAEVENPSKGKKQSLLNGKGYVYQCTVDDCSGEKSIENESFGKLLDIQNGNMSPPSAVFSSETGHATLLIKNLGIRLLVTANFIDGQSENLNWNSTMSTTTASASKASSPAQTTGTTSRPMKNKEKPPTSKNPTLQEIFSTISMSLAPTTTIKTAKTPNDSTMSAKTTTTTEIPQLSPSPPRKRPAVDENLLLKDPVEIQCNSKLDARHTFGHPFRLMVREAPPREPKDQPEPEPVPLTSEIRYCSLSFESENPNQVVQLAIFNYQLRGKKCSSAITVNTVETVELELGQEDSGPKSRRLDIICESSPIKIRRYAATGTRMSVDIYMSADDEPLSTSEFLEGVFRFHEIKDGKLKRDTLCDIVYEGAKVKSGHILTPKPTDSFPFPFLFTMDCHFHFQPNKQNRRLENILLMIQGTNANEDTNNEYGVESIMKNYPKCYTVCRDQGCQCIVTGSNTLENVDHLTLFSQRKDVLEIGCFCGRFGQHVPILYESDATLILKHHRVSPVARSGSDSDSNEEETQFAIKFSFSLLGNAYCSKFTLSPPGSTKEGNDLITGVRYPGSEFHYQNFLCSWFFKNSAIHELNIDFSFPESSEKKDECPKWSLKIFGVFIDFHNHDERKELFSLCRLPVAEAVAASDSNSSKTERTGISIPANISHGFILVNGTVKEKPKFNLHWTYNDTNVELEKIDANGANFHFLYFNHQILVIYFIILFFNMHFMNFF